MNQVYEFDSYHVSPLFCFVFLMPLLMTKLTQNDVCQTNEANERIGQKIFPFVEKRSRKSFVGTFQQFRGNRVQIFERQYESGDMERKRGLERNEDSWRERTRDPGREARGSDSPIGVAIPYPLESKSPPT